MKPPFNVLHIVSTHLLSGAERIVQFIGRYLNHELFQPIIVCAGDPLRQIYEQEGHIVETCQVSLPLPQNIIQLRSIIKNRNIHLIHAHDHRASLTAWVSTRQGRRIPVISHIHSANPWLKGWNIFKGVEMFLRNRYDISLACSETVREHYFLCNPGLKQDKVITVTNGIEIPEISPINRYLIAEDLGIQPQCFIFGTVGRLAEPKGIDLLLQAFKQVAGVLDNVVLLIVGSGPDEKALKKLAEELGLGERIIFAGFREDVYNMLQIMDVFVLASRWEGLPMALMEAMAHTLPVIAADVGGVRELLRHGETGLLVNSGDIQALAEQMIYLYREREAAARLAAAGRNLVIEKFDITKQVRKIEEVYRLMLGGEGSCQDRLNQ